VYRIVPSLVTLLSSAVRVADLLHTQWLSLVSPLCACRELLRGPLFYVITTALVTIVFWRTSPIGAISLVMMCGGDGECAH